MNAKSAVYTNSDEEFREICKFLNALSARDPFMSWESCRMNYWRYTIHGDKDPQDSFFRDNVHLWRAENKTIVGLFISEYGDSDFFVEVLPEYRGLYADIFRWTEAHWAAARTVVEIDVFSNDADKISILEALGFEFKCHFENKRVYELEKMDLGYTLEDGFSVQSFAESSDYAGRVELVQKTFDNPRYVQENLKGLIASPDYIGEYNLSVVSPEQKQVAYCVGWHEQAREYTGYIEPMGTHPAYRRRGFAKALAKECFARMKANGIRQVEIASRAEPDVSNFLYDSLCPQTKREVHKYAKTAL